MNHIKRILKKLNDPAISFKSGKVCVRWVCESYKDLQRTLLLITDCFHEEGYHGYLFIAVRLRVDEVTIQTTERFFILQYPQNHSLTNGCNTSGSPRN